MKYMKFLIFCSVLLFACTKVDFQEDLPIVSNLDPWSINSKLKRIHITVNKNEWDLMYQNFHSEIETECSVDFFDENGNLIVPDRMAFLEIRGAGSAGFPMKPLGLLFVDVLDNAQYEIMKPRKVLSQHELSSLQNLRLRNSGNDYGYTQIKDFILTEFAIDYELKVDIKYAEPVHVFVNGSYYGLLNLRNEADEVALAHMYNCQPEDITYVKVDITNGNLKHTNGDELLVSELISALKNFKTEELMSLIDINSFIDYIIIEDYFGNDDWPHNNVAAYSINGAPFKFVLYDLDQALFRTKDPCLPELEYLSADLAKIYQGLIKNENFVDQLEERQAELFGQFSVNHFNSLVDEITVQIQAEIPYLISKWQAPQSTFQWKINVESLKRDFLQRDKRLRKFYKL